MRELTVYYCPKCGHYGYYQTSKDAPCPVCQEKMKALPMTYKNFMRLDFKLRDELISHQIAGDIVPVSSVVQRITELEKSCDSRYIIAELKTRLDELDAENTELRRKNAEHEKTIQWMHDLIWDLTRKLHSKH